LLGCEEQPGRRSVPTSCGSPRDFRVRLATAVSVVLAEMSGLSASPLHSTLRVMVRGEQLGYT
jgi:hypothetical protein